MRTLLVWSRRLLVATLVGAVLARILGSNGRAGGGAGLVPDIGGDTWPPVPVNPARRT